MSMLAQQLICSHSSVVPKLVVGTPHWDPREILEGHKMVEGIRERNILLLKIIFEKGDSLFTLTKHLRLRIQN